MTSQVPMTGPTRSVPQDPHAGINIANFRWQAIDVRDQAQHDLNAPTTATNPPLGVLSNFKGVFTGTGLNTIFRPNSAAPTTTNFPRPVTPSPPNPPSENVLEINLTAETLSFGAELGSVPNRGLEGQNDIFLNGVPYVQSINDVANQATGKADGKPIGIHFETGVWMHLPATTADPPLGASLVRMGSIPHGTTINAQSLEPSKAFSGPPQIPATNITPFIIGSRPPQKIPFIAQTATNHATPRIPQDLTKFITAGTITQDILTDPNTVLRNANKGKKIVQTEVFTINTTPQTPELGGGTANIAFLVGTSNAGPNANAVSMQATFWINTVETKVVIPVLPPLGTHEIALQPPHPGAPVPNFAVHAPAEGIHEPTSVVLRHTEIQYSQLVELNFAGLTWPHVSVATLVPKAEHPVHLPSPT